MKPWLLAVVLLGFFAAPVACSQQDRGLEKIVPDRGIEEVLKRHTNGLMSLPGVVGTAQGECAGKPCVQVLVVKKTADLINRIPSSLEGYTVVIQETGEIKAR